MYFPRLVRASSFNLASGKPMHQIQDGQTVEPGARGGRLPVVASRAVAAPSHEEEENTPSLVQFQFRNGKREQGLSNAARGN
jgi:hypothetical protein